jgi:hypothetical protein
MNGELRLKSVLFANFGDRALRPGHCDDLSSKNKNPVLALWLLA